MPDSGSRRKNSNLRIPVQSTSDELFPATSEDAYGDLKVKNTFLDFRTVSAAFRDCINPENQARRAKSLELDSSNKSDEDTPSKIFGRASLFHHNIPTPRDVDDHVRATANVTIPCAVANEADAIGLAATHDHALRSETLTQCSTATPPIIVASQNHPARNSSIAEDDDTIAPHIREIVLEQTKLHDEIEERARMAAVAENAHALFDVYGCHCKEYQRGPNETRRQGHASQDNELHISDLIRLPVAPQQLPPREQPLSQHFMPPAKPALQQQQWQSLLFMPVDRKPVQQQRPQQHRTVSPQPQIPNKEYTERMNGAHSGMMPVYTSAQQQLSYQVPVFQSDCGNDHEQPHGYYQEERRTGEAQGSQHGKFRNQVIEQQRPLCSSCSLSDHPNHADGAEHHYSEISTSHWKTSANERAPLFDGALQMELPSRWTMRMDGEGSVGIYSAQQMGAARVERTGRLRAGAMVMHHPELVRMPIEGAIRMGLAEPPGMHNTELMGAPSATLMGIHGERPMGTHNPEMTGMHGTNSIGPQSIETQSPELTEMQGGESIRRMRSRVNSSPTSTIYNNLGVLPHNKIPRKRDLRHEFESKNTTQAVTTIMLRNIPNRYKQSELVEEINKSGFDGTYDFVYLPMDLSTYSNVGYAFINFINEQFALRAMQAFTGYRFSMYQNASKKVVCISIAHIQGFEANLKHYQQTAINDSRINEHRPLVKQVASQGGRN